jgi:hypothetical protein
MPGFPQRVAFLTLACWRRARGRLRTLSSRRRGKLLRFLLRAFAGLRNARSTLEQVVGYLQVVPMGNGHAVTDPCTDRVLRMAHRQPRLGRPA